MPDKHEWPTTVKILGNDVSVVYGDGAALKVKERIGNVEWCRLNARVPTFPLPFPPRLNIFETLFPILGQLKIDRWHEKSQQIRMINAENLKEIQNGLRKQVAEIAGCSEDAVICIVHSLVNGYDEWEVRAKAPFIFAEDDDNA